MGRGCLAMKNFPRKNRRLAACLSGQVTRIAAAKVWVLLCAGLMWVYPAGSALAVAELAASIQDQMVVQRGAPWLVSGTAGDLDNFIVEFLGKKINVKPYSGKWSVQFDIPSDAFGPAELVGDGGRLVKKVLIGDVWLCSGQSNMALNIARSVDGAEIAKYAATQSVSIYQVAKPIKKPQPATGRWAAATSENTKSFSAVCLAFGASLSEQTKAPIGLIDASLGGTWIESWLSAEGFNKVSSARASEVRYQQRARQIAQGKMNVISGIDRPSQLFDLMIKPLTVQPIKGVLWYQGEGNRVNADNYGEMLSILIGDWRTHWGQPLLPFVVMQLPGFGSLASNFEAKSGWAIVREAQRAVASSSQRVGLVVTVDLGDGAIHPGRKLRFGQRAADVAYALAYTTHENPGIFPTKVSIKGNTVAVEFNHGRACLEGTSLLPNLVYVAGSDQHWFAAEVEVERSAIVARSSSVPSPVAVRYAWSDNPGVGLRSCHDGVPVTPFRSDDWSFSQKTRLP